ncbi:TIGR02117 family protein [Hymenobacter sp. BT635]|uniref:TIGR02117 family protein n=1 Tax=Hymenobacter nitidus TaxID=2880929 RepID=A0ABS8AA60_9BACT|nr:TIGR02117 family protein [Hymenobacter nitidus]MCB2376617.1 TIGR02117 family protein [Hymenobacter nitidus]
MYAALAFLLLFFSGTRLPLNRQFRPAPGGVPVFVVSNGFHTDIVVPLREPRTGTDWLRQLHQPQLTSRFAHYQYVAFGWGSERFYLASYGGRMPGMGTVLRAVGPGRTLMHVDFYQQAPQPGRRVVALQLSAAQYQRLTTLLQESFAPDSTGATQLRNAAGYTPDDFFFRARGRYHALRTCNDWTVRTLRRTGVRVPLKSPLAGPVLRQLRRSHPAAEPAAP